MAIVKIEKAQKPNFLKCSCKFKIDKQPVATLYMDL